MRINTLVGDAMLPICGVHDRQLIGYEWAMWNGYDEKCNSVYIGAVSQLYYKDIKRKKK